MTPARPWIAYVGPVPFPEGGAAARRILGNAKALVAAGYDVTIVSGHPPDDRGAGFQWEPGIRCVRINERDAEHLPKALRYMRYATMGSRSRRWLETQPSLPEAIILYSGYSPYLLQFTNWARRRGIALLFDAVEWYAAPTFLRFLVSPYLWNTEFAMRCLIPRLDGVVAISHALEDFYRKRGCPVGRVPPLTDLEQVEIGRRQSDALNPLQLVYAGSPGRKDLLGMVAAAVMAVDDGQKRLVLDVVGVTPEELLMQLPAQTGDLPGCLRAHGRVSHARALELVGQADFSVFLRQVNKVSTNGFPTKFVESLSLGTPVITNVTSDLAEHLRDAETGFICPAPTSTALQATLERALRSDPEDREAMREAARAEAERSFDFRNHVVTLRDLIDTSRQNLSRRIER